MVKGLQTLAITLITCLGLLLGGGHAYGAPAFLEGTMGMIIPAMAEVPTVDIDKFVEAYQSIQGIRDRAEADMAKAVETEKLTVDRFNDIADGMVDEQPETLSASEQQQFDSALEQIIAIRQTAEAEMESAIDRVGLTVEKFNDILDQSDQDEALYQRIGEAINGKS